MAPRRRLDAELVRRNLAASRDSAKRLIEEGRILVDGAVARKPAYQVNPAQAVSVSGPPPRFVSRAGEKLAGAIERFGVDPVGRHCVDIGSSTGGFTDCLLQGGAASVVAIDVGTHQLHEKLRNDGRVQVREQTDFRKVLPRQFPNGVSLAVGDVSFISLRLLLSALATLEPIDSVLLIKPQFEAGRQEASRAGGVIEDPTIWRRVLTEVLDAANQEGFATLGLMVSPITGRAGNVEFVSHLGRNQSLRQDQTGEAATQDRDLLVDGAIAEAMLKHPGVGSPDITGVDADGETADRNDAPLSGEGQK